MDRAREVLPEVLAVLEHRVRSKGLADRCKSDDDAAKVLAREFGTALATCGLRRRMP